jgi:predicted DNA-binding transcriptional regulator AlpA
VHTTHPRILLDERDAAAALGLTPRTLQAWRSAGEGPPHVRISSRCVRYRVADLEDWAEARLRRSTSDFGTAAAA